MFRALATSQLAPAFPFERNAIFQGIYVGSREGYIGNEVIMCKW